MTLPTKLQKWNTYNIYSKEGAYTTKTEAVERAVKSFDSGFNYAEAVLLALSEGFHQVTPVIPRIATGFCAGISRTGRICGALNGAIMAIVLQEGCDKAEEKQERNAIYVDV
jgi:hypothetical protein